MDKVENTARPGGFLSWAARVLSAQRLVRAIGDFFHLLVARRELTMELARRDLGSAHAGHSFGSAWVYIHPMIVALVFMIVFGFVFGARIKLPEGFTGQFSAYVLAGLTPWLTFQATIIRSTGALTSNANLVKQVVFPIEVLPVATVISSTLAYVPALLATIVFSFYSIGSVPWTAVLLPLVVLMHLMLGFGLAYALAGLTAFVRDLREFVNVFCVIAMYITPAVYLEEWVPRELSLLLYFNPFSYLVWVYQDTLFHGQILHPWAWVVLAVMSTFALAGGWRLFVKLKPFYGNVL